MKQKNPKYYLSLIRMGILEAMQYRLGIVIMIIGNLLYLIVVYYLWKAIFASSITATVNGMTFTDTLIYLVLAAAIFNFMEMYDIVWHIGNCIRSGKIVLELLKPIQYKKYLFWFYSGRFVINFFLTFLPTFIIVIMLTKGAINIGVNLLVFMISILMAVFINYCIDFFIARGIQIRRFFCWNDMLLYRIYLGDKYNEAGHSFAFIRSNYPACFFP